MSEQTEAVDYTAILGSIQRHGKDVDQFREQLALELRVLADFLTQRKPEGEMEGLAKGAAGGALYCILQYLNTFGEADNLTKWMQRYAEVELYSYPAGQDKLEEMKQWQRDQGVVVRAIGVQCPDGENRHIFASHIKQTTINGRALEEGEVIPFPLRYPPPYRELIDLVFKT